MAQRDEKLKLISQDLSGLLDESQVFKNMTKAKKNKKRTKEVSEDRDNSKTINSYNNVAKKEEIELSFESNIRRKIVEAIEQQYVDRKKLSQDHIQKLKAVRDHIEIDHKMMVENENKLEQAVGALFKRLKQSTASNKQKLDELEEIIMAHKKECEDFDCEYTKKMDKLADIVKQGLSRLRETLQMEYKRRQVESLRKSFFHALQNDL